MSNKQWAIICINIIYSTLLKSTEEIMLKTDDRFCFYWNIVYINGFYIKNCASRFGLPEVFLV